MSQSTIFVAILALSAIPVIRGQCTVSDFSQVASAVASCTTITLNAFTVPAKQTLKLTLKANAQVNINGKITFAHSEWEGPLMEISGKSVSITGSSGGVLDGLGAQHWDGKGEHGTTKPKFIYIHTTGGSTLNNVNLLNCPQKCISVPSNAADTTFINCDIDISAGDSLGKNTDGFDISGSGITISGGKIHNQDDCVAINKGSNIRVSGLTCIGGHGLSISAGVGQSVASISNVVFSNSVVQNSRNGIHIKTHTDAPAGTVTDVHYNNITMSGITNYGINVQQDYKNGGPTKTASNNIKIDKLILNGVTGSVSGSNAQSVYILCGNGSCTNWNWSGVSITGGSKANECSIKPPGYTGCP